MVDVFRILSRSGNCNGVGVCLAKQIQPFPVSVQPLDPSFHAFTAIRVTVLSTRAIYLCTSTPGEHRQPQPRQAPLKYTSSPHLRPTRDPPRASLS